MLIDIIFLMSYSLRKADFRTPYCSTPIDCIKMAPILPWPDTIEYVIRMISSVQKFQKSLLMNCLFHLVSLYSSLHQ